jgi:hypothetical protein
MSANRLLWALVVGGRAALASRGAGGARCKLTAAQLGELEAVLAAGSGRLHAGQAGPAAAPDRVERAGPGAADRGVA